MGSNWVPWWVGFMVTGNSLGRREWMDFFFAVLLLCVHYFVRKCLLMLSMSWWSLVGWFNFLAYDLVMSCSDCNLQLFYLRSLILYRFNLNTDPKKTAKKTAMTAAMMMAMMKKKKKLPPQRSLPPTVAAVEANSFAFPEENSYVPRRPMRKRTIVMMNPRRRRTKKRSSRFIDLRAGSSLVGRALLLEAWGSS